MPKTTSALLGNQELAELLGVTAMDVRNWHRRGKLPPPVASLAYGPVWEKAQFPAALRRELAGAGDPWRSSSTSQRSGKRRKTTRSTKA